MKIGCIKERMDGELRVAITPSQVKLYLKDNNILLIETGAGIGAGYSDKEYQELGAKIVSQAECWKADVIVKVKEPITEEYKFFYPGLIIFAYFSLTTNKKLLDALLKNKVTSFAYETVRNISGFAPLLSPMSEIAGSQAVLIAANLLNSLNGSAGLCPAIIDECNFVILGGGNAGFNAARVAFGMGSKVSILENYPPRIEFLKKEFNNKIEVIESSKENIKKYFLNADVIISSLATPEMSSEKLVSKEIVASMKKGSVIIDIGVDQGSPFETITNHTTHDDPTFLVDGIVHYAVSNIPGIVPKTASNAVAKKITNYVFDFFNIKNIKKEVQDEIKTGINTFDSKVANSAVSKKFNIELSEYKF